MNKNKFNPSLHFSYTMNFRVTWPDWPHPFFTMPTPKIFSHLLICMKQHAKNQLIPSLHSWDTVNFRVQRPDWPNPFLTMPNQKFSNTTNFYNWKLNITWSCKLIICKRITEYTWWSVSMLLTRHIKFCKCDDSTSKQIMACVGACECDRMPFIDRPEHAKNGGYFINLFWRNSWFKNPTL